MATTVVNYKLTNEYDVCISRPSKWGNPFRIGEDGTREEVIAKYRKYILETPELMNSLYQIRGKVLGCCCKPYACHGDVLVELADKPLRVIIAGGRDFNYFDFLESTLLRLFEYYDKDTLIIVSGMARGADRLGFGFAKKYGIKVDEYPANWYVYGKSAGYIRNEEMARVADAAVCFWNGHSTGTGHMIDLARQYNLQVKVVRYDVRP